MAFRPHAVPDETLKSKGSWDSVLSSQDSRLVSLVKDDMHVVAFAVVPKQAYLRGRRPPSSFIVEFMDDVSQSFLHVRINEEESPSILELWRGSGLLPHLAPVFGVTVPHGIEEDYRGLEARPDRLKIERINAREYLVTFGPIEIKIELQHDKAVEQYRSRIVFRLGQEVIDGDLADGVLRCRRAEDPFRYRTDGITLDADLSEFDFGRRYAVIRKIEDMPDSGGGFRLGVYEVRDESDGERKIKYAVVERMMTGKDYVFHVVGEPMDSLNDMLAITQLMALNHNPALLSLPDPRAGESNA